MENGIPSVAYDPLLAGWSYDFTSVGQRRRAHIQTPATTPAAAASAKRSYPLMTRLGVNAWWSSSEAPYRTTRMAAHMASNVEAWVAYVKDRARISKKVRPPYSVK